MSETKSTISLTHLNTGVLTTPILLIGVGNRYRSDDAVGILIAEEIQKRNIPNVSVVIHSGEGASLMEAWDGFQHIIIIDAVSSGTLPGTIHRLNAHLNAIPSNFFNYSTHAFSLAEAIELARAIGKLPQQVQIIGIEGEDFSMKEGLTQNVSEAMGIVIEEVTAALTLPDDSKKSR